MRTGIPLGLMLAGSLGFAAVLDDFSGNTITGVISKTSGAAPALSINGETSAKYYPAIRRARNNRIVGNDSGVRCSSNGASNDLAAPLRPAPPPL